MSPASSPIGFIGDLADIGFDWPRRVMIVRAVLPVQDFEPFRRGIGLPPASDPAGEPEAGPPVMLLPCRRPRHPERDADAMADAALEVLEQLVAGGTLRIDPRFSRRIEALATAIQFQPWHLTRSAEEGVL